MASRSITLTYEGKIVSVNEWKQPVDHGRRMIKTPRYRAFSQELVGEFFVQRMKQNFAPITVPCEAVVIVSLPDSWDTSNITKPLFDALEEAAVVENDRLIESYTMMRTPIPFPKGTGCIGITITEKETT